MSRRLSDGHGRLVPKRLYAAFSARETICKYFDELQVWSRKLKDRKDTLNVVGLSIPNIRKMLLDVQLKILDSLPYLICSCDSDQSCKRCGGRGWLAKKDISATGLFALPDDSKAEPPQTTTSPQNAS